MNRTNIIKVVSIVIITSIFVAGCMSSAVKYPKTFVQGIEPMVTTIELAQGTEAAAVWSNIVASLAQKYTLETISKELGKITTAWNYTSEGKDKSVQNYRTRALLQFSSDWTKLDIKTEANYLQNNTWLVGYDTKLLETIASELTKVLGIQK